MPPKKDVKQPTQKRRAVKQIPNRPLRLPSATRQKQSEINVDFVPASFLRNSRKIATLSQYIDDTVPTLALDELSESQWRKIAVNRINADPAFEVMIPGFGVFRAENAEKEINNKSEVGKTLLL